MAQSRATTAASEETVANNQSNDDDDITAHNMSAASGSQLLQPQRNAIVLETISLIDDDDEDDDVVADDDNGDALPVAGHAATITNTTIRVPETTSSNATAAATTTTTITNNIIDLCDIDDETPSCSNNNKTSSVTGATASRTSDETIAETSASSMDDAAASGDAAAAAATTAAVLECPICLLTCVHPTRLPCGHIFCYLCVKGVANKNHRCAMCRRNIPAEFLEHPQLVNGTDDICMTKATDDGYQWFYEGRNGWWQYDDRTSQDIEDAYKKGEKSCTILVAGYVYIVDLEAMLQQRQNEPTRCRRVKRDLATIPKKGVAGLRIDSGNIVTAETGSNSSRQMLLPFEFVDSAPPGGSNVSTIAATDAAIRIASDIIGSTLAHADELTRRRSSMPTLASDIVAANSSNVSGLYGEQLYDVNNRGTTSTYHARTRSPQRQHNYTNSHQRQQQRQQHRAQRRQQQQELLFSSMRGIFKDFFLQLFGFYRTLFYSPAGSSNTATATARTTNSNT